MKRTKNRIHTVLFMLLIALAMTAVVGCRSTRKATLPGALTLKELKNLPVVKAEKDCEVYCPICHKILDVKAGEVIPRCCGKLMEVMK